MPKSEDEEEGDDGAAAQQTHRFVRGVAGATPQGAGCVELRLKPQLKASLVSAHREDEEEGDDSAAAQLTHQFVRGVAGATPQGARCVELRLKPQLGVAARSELASPTSSCLPTGRGRRCRSWRSCRLPRRLVPPVPPEPLAARPLVGLASGATHFKKRKVHQARLVVVVVVAPVWSLFGRHGLPTVVG